jgi:iron complex outermembrane receptor protein
MVNSPLSNLKLRAGWGQTGNQEIPAKITKARFRTDVSSSTSYPLYPDGPYPGGTTYTRFANEDIQWEVSTQTNIGLDFGFLQGALTGSVDYFNKVSDNILLLVSPPDPIQPAQFFWRNFKDMNITNKGLEVALDYQFKTTGSFTYSVGGNMTFTNNEVTGSPSTVIPSGTASGAGLSGIAINGYLNGEAIGSYYMLDFVGIDENGLNIYRDVVEDGEITDKDRIVAGSALPTTMYNFYGNVGYRGFDLSFNFNGVSGNKIYDNTANSNFIKSRLYKSGNTTAAAMEFPNESDTNPTGVSTRFLKNGAFLRLNNLSLGYNLKPAMLGIESWVNAIRLSVTGQNLFVITDYDGYDPEVNTERNQDGVNSYGIDYLSYPKARSVVFGLNVKF